MQEIIRKECLELVDKQWIGLEKTDIRFEKYNDKILLTFKYDKGKAMFLFKKQTNIIILFYEFINGYMKF
jgi:hypothetical protein